MSERKREREIERERERVGATGGEKSYCKEYIYRNKS